MFAIQRRFVDFSKIGKNYAKTTILFADDFASFYEYFLSQPHKERLFKKGEYLWKPDQPYDRIQYYVYGASFHFAEHESGRRKIISFHGKGTFFQVITPLIFELSGR